MIFFVILGLLSAIMAFLLLGFYVRIFKYGSVIGKICEIDGPFASHAPGVTIFHIEVQFNEDGSEKKLVAFNRFIVLPLFERFKLSQLRKKHIGRQIHIYYNPDNNAQVLLREYMWKEILMCVFLLCLGILLILTGVYRWY